MTKIKLDPSANVLHIVEGAIKRLDDLRASEVRMINEKIDLHIEYIEKLSLAESKRLDAIRSVDVGTVAIASERAAATATVLASQVSQSAETLRTLVASTAASVAANLSQVSAQLTDRLALLEKKQYENQGKSSVTDPQLDALLKKMDTVIESRATNTGQGMGRKEMYGWIVGGIMTLITIIGFLSKVI